MEHLQGMQKPLYVSFFINTNPDISSPIIAGVVAKQIKTGKTFRLSSHLSPMLPVYTIQPVAVTLLPMNVPR
jgi:hypothetical protein